MRSPSELSWATLLLCCAVTTITTSLLVSLALEQARQRDLQVKAARQEAKATVATSADDKPPPPPAPVKETTSPPRPVVDLRTMPSDEVPAELRVDAFFSAQHINAFDHSAIFRGCTNVFAVIDAIHPYLETFFSESSWVGASSASKNVTILKTSGKRGRDGRYAGDSDDDDDDDDDDDSVGATVSRQWRMPECIDPAEATEIILYPGVDSRTFAPEKIINLDPNAPAMAPIGSPRAGRSSSYQRPLSPSPRRYSYGRSASFESDPDRPRPKKRHVVILPGALILGGVFDVSEGSIHIGKNVRVEPNVHIKGPCIIGDHSTVRSGAYLRGDVVVGRRVVLRGELKNALVMDNAELCHPGYCGDSICGYKSHFGNQVTTANLNLFSNTSSSEILVETAHGQRYNTGRKKIGVVLGDYSQLGCSTVTDPCTLLQPNTIVYALTRLRKGIYGPNVIIKNKPMEHGVLEIAPLVLPPSSASDAAASGETTAALTTTAAATLHIQTQ